MLISKAGLVSKASLAALAAIAITLSVMTPVAAATKRPPAHRGPPPFCISRGGGDGASGTRTDCQFYDYQACLQAAAAGGNCVANIDAK